MAYDYGDQYSYINPLADTFGDSNCQIVPNAKPAKILLSKWGFQHQNNGTYCKNTDPYGDVVCVSEKQVNDMYGNYKVACGQSVTQLGASWTPAGGETPPALTSTVCVVRPTDSEAMEACTYQAPYMGM